MTEIIRDNGRANGIIPRLKRAARFSPALLAVLVLGCSDANTRDVGSCDPVGCAGGTSCADGLCVPDHCQGTLAFEDASLERAVREAAGGVEGALVYADVRDIVELDASLANLDAGVPVASLGGVQCLTGLERLVLDGAEVRDLSPLRELRLRELSLVSTPVSDLGPLAGIASLESLDLGSGRGLDAPRDLEPVAALPRLRTLGIAFGQVADLGPLASLASLESLDARANSISDVSVLAGLTGLRRLELDANRIEDVGPLSALGELELLDLSNNAVTDVTPIAANEGLGHGDRVELSDNPLDCRTLLQAEVLELLLDRGVDLLVDCLSCLFEPTGLDCVCWAYPDLQECRCHFDPLGCLCEDTPDAPACTCYFYPGDPSCQD
jgi:internalin A